MLLQRLTTMTHPRLGRLWLLLVILASSSLPRQVHGLRVAVFGGSGFIGRRICQTLVKAGCEVCSVSRSGKPPSYYCCDSWSNQVEWISHDLGSSDDSLLLDKLKTGGGESPIDSAISCVGNLQPTPEWRQLFGLSFDDDRLMIENGAWNEKACRASKEAGAKQFVFLSVNYEVAKALEGPIAGYIYGKRRAESKACELYGADQTTVLGLSLVYGGQRFPNVVGKLYRGFVESPVVKAYVMSNQSLRNLSVAPLQDWVEQMVFCCLPVSVETVARVATAAALGKITKDMVGPRKQGFFDTNGKAVEYEDVVFVDGTAEIERLDASLMTSTPSSKPQPPVNSNTETGAPFWEGALVGKKPLLFPIPVALTFATIFWSVATQQFVQIASI